MNRTLPIPKGIKNTSEVPFQTKLAGVKSGVPTGLGLGATIISDLSK